MATFLHLTIPVDVKARASQTTDTVALDLGNAGTTYLERDAAFALADQLRDALRELAARPQEER